MKQTGKKFDENKPRTDLLPMLALIEVANVMRYGANKYGDHNWLGGLNCCRLLGASLRHIFQWIGGKTLDKESGYSHLAHAAASCLMALETLMRRPDLDDRYKEEKKECHSICDACLEKD